MISYDTATAACPCVSKGEKEVLTRVVLEKHPELFLPNAVRVDLLGKGALLSWWFFFSYTTAVVPFAHRGAAGLIGIAVIPSYVAIALLARRMRSLDSHRSILWSAAILATLGSLASFWIPWTGAVVVGIVACGVGTAVLGVAQGEAYAQADVSTVTWYTTVSMLFAFVVYVLAGQLPLAVQACVAAAMPLLCAAALAGGARRSEAGASISLPGSTLRFPLPWRLVMFIGVYGLSFGLVQRLVPQAGVAWGMLIGTALFGIWGVLFSGRFVLSMVFRILLPVATAVTLALPLFGTNPMFYIGFCVACAFLDSLLWVLLARVSFCSGDATRVFAWGKCIQECSLGVGMLVADQLINPLGVGHAIAPTISAVAAAALVVATMLVLNKSDLFQGSAAAEENGLVSENAAGAVVFDPCAQMAQRYGLSVRELDVLRLLADRRSIPYIGEVLHLAPSTVKTHCKHIYERLGVHARSEVLVLIAQEEPMKGAPYPSSRKNSANSGIANSTTP